MLHWANKTFSGHDETDAQAVVVAAVVVVVVVVGVAVVMVTAVNIKTTANASTRDGTGSPGHGSAGHRVSNLGPGRVGSRVKALIRLFDPDACSML